MTNKLEIDRELAERLDNPQSYVRNLAREELRVLLANTDAGITASVATPVVERQCCTPTPEEEQLLANGDYTPEELWGGSRPTCPKCLNTSPAAPVAVTDDLAQNAKRYEWIRSPNIGHCEISRVLFETISDDCNPPYRSLKCGKDLDAAIDACLDKVKELNQ